MLVAASVAEERVRRRQWVRILAGGCLLSLCAGGAVAAPGREPSEAMAFVRVLADVSIDFGGMKDRIDRKDVELATGSGFVISPSGLVLTSRHVIAAEGPAAPAEGPFEAKVSVDNRRVEVAIGPGGSQSFVAWVAAADAETDLAALQVAASDLASLPLGDSDAVEPGQAVQVLGFPFGRQVEVGRQSRAGLAPSVTVAAGSLSAARQNDEGQTRYLQTDASVNPGSSGGPMLDPDGYVVGVVRMKLSRDGAGSGPGFAVPVNMVKDFLDAQGLLGQLPVGRLRPGTVHSLDWKRLRIELPDGFQDGSPSRLRAELGRVEDVEARIDRVATTLETDAFEQSLLGGALPGFAPGRVVRHQRLTAGVGDRHLVLGYALGEGAEGQRLRVEYALVEYALEKIVARYLGPADAVAFNLGLIRRSLSSLVAEKLRAPLPPEASLVADRPGPDGPFSPARFPRGPAQPIPMPAGWVVETSEDPPCAGVPQPDAGIGARHRVDYALSLRAWSWGRALSAAELRSCAAEGRVERFGIDFARRRASLRRGEETLLLELEAPGAWLAPASALFDRWLQAIASDASR